VSYAVLWREGDGPVKAGKLVLGPASLRLESGASRNRLTTESLRYGELSSVAKARDPAQRIHGRPTAVVRRKNREPLVIAAIDRLGSADEIVERLNATISGRMQP